MIEARVIADSENTITGSRLTTMLIQYPRFIHSELMTHRMFARNASSSRAIPAARLRAMVRSDPAMPVEWGRNQPGMQSRELMSPVAAAIGKFLWLSAMHVALLCSWGLEKLGAHKQIVNRIIEPWTHIMVVLTGSFEAYANFYHLRDHADADPTIHALARAMRKAHKESGPQKLSNGQVHIPFVSEAEFKELGIETAVRCSAARCARTSYASHDGTPTTVVKDLALFTRLMGSEPLHASPAEHQAQALSESEALGSEGCLGRGTGWQQFRKTLPNEFCKNFIL